MCNFNLFQIFESSAEYLGPEHFRKYSLKYLTMIVKNIKKVIKVPIIVFCKGAHYAVSGIGKLTLITI